MWQNEAVVGKQHLCTSRTSSCSLLEYTVWELETDPSLCLFYYQRLPACSVLWTLTLRQVSWRKKKAVRANHEALQSELNNCPFENPTWAPHELIRAVKDFVLGVSDGESWLPRWKKKKNQTRDFAWGFTRFCMPQWGWYPAYFCCLSICSNLRIVQVLPGTPPQYRQCQTWVESTVNAYEVFCTLKLLKSTTVATPFI